MEGWNFFKKDKKPELTGFAKKLDEMSEEERAAWVAKANVEGEKDAVERKAKEDAALEQAKKNANETIGFKGNY